MKFAKLDQQRRHDVMRRIKQPAAGFLRAVGVTFVTRASFCFVEAVMTNADQETVKKGR